MICVKCKRDIKGSFSRDCEIICERCLLAVADEMDKLGLPPFSVYGLYWALRTGALTKWMKKNNIGTQKLEQWTKIDQRLWKRWADNREKVTDLSTGEIRASVYAALREANQRTYVTIRG